MSRAVVSRWVLAVIGVGFVLTSAACLQPSLNPLLGPEDARTDPRLLGTWTCNDKRTETWTFEKKDGSEKNKAYSYYEIRIGTTTGRPTFGRVMIDADRIRIKMMPAEWGDDHKEDVTDGLGASQGEHGYVFTAPTAALQALVLTHADDKDAFRDAVLLVRPGKTGGSCYSEK